MLNWITTYFLPPGFSGTEDEHRQAVIIATSILLTVLFSLNYSILCWWLGLVPGIYIMSASAVVFAGIVWLFKISLLSSRQAGYAFNLTGILTVFLCSYYLGGFHSEVTIWLVAMPLVGTFLLGRTGGRISFAVSLSLLILLWGLDYWGVALPAYAGPGKYLLPFYQLNIAVGLMLIIVVIANVFTNTNERAFRLLNEKNELLRQRTDQLQESLHELKLTQNQLIQSEKMASLGELIAGIAHEIQNPLNFVNNFSELSTELIDELLAERQSTTPDPALEAELLSDLNVNLQKITHHGQRASSIVKGMLEHARTPTGQREPTNLNALTDEYMRLAYHGLRAKNKDFNCKLITEFDSELELVRVVPQDIGRVLLNLFTNAFYAVQQRQKTSLDAEYQPMLSVRTQQADGRAILTVIDNGTGIPVAVQGKIFQPFFTTKPTGEGTGLGLSLSYDIVTKGHNGTLEVVSAEGEGTEFTVSLPLV